ncbi:MAG: peptide deformylase [Candidatus Hydrogenedentes bacterium]|nr:peptide deformylase [Candidatus Hydrogenedentota bacterium]MBI3118435.1 peptide deformylase [Candidatus Hydrogenedentota bacterium]
MAVLDLVLYPDHPLTVKAVPYESVGSELAQLAEDMLETMHAYAGVGLAGPQVGISKRIFVLCEPEGEPMCLINPEILEMEGCEEGEEGCLSMPQVFANVPRATRIRVRALNELGKPQEFEARDFLARIIQHEYDHLEGILFPDRLDIITREAKLQEWETVRKQLLEAATRR